MHPSLTRGGVEAEPPFIPSHSIQVLPISRIGGDASAVREYRPHDQGKFPRRVDPRGQGDAVPEEPGDVRETFNQHHCENKSKTIEIQILNNKVNATLSL